MVKARLRLASSKRGTANWAAPPSLRSRRSKAVWDPTVAAASAPPPGPPFMPPQTEITVGRKAGRVIGAALRRPLQITADRVGTWACWGEVIRNDLERYPLRRWETSAPRYFSQRNGQYGRRHDALRRPGPAVGDIPVAHLPPPQSCTGWLQKSTLDTSSYLRAHITGARHKWAHPLASCGIYDAAVPGGSDAYPAIKYWASPHRGQG